MKIAFYSAKKKNIYIYIYIAFWDSLWGRAKLKKKKKKKKTNEVNRF